MHVGRRCECSHEKFLKESGVFLAGAGPVLHRLLSATGGAQDSRIILPDFLKSQPKPGGAYFRLASRGERPPGPCSSLTVEKLHCGGVPLLQSRHLTQ
jgi:hypothetical protein